MLNGFPYLISEDANQLTPLMLITEYPDETLTGEPLCRRIPRKWQRWWRPIRPFKRSY